MSGIVASSRIGPKFAPKPRATIWPVMPYSAFALVLAATIACAALAADAAAAPKQTARPRSDAPPSLDGRTTGTPRTCGYDYFIYSPSGGTVGPYCH
jgi:hypothetical protein